MGSITATTTTNDCQSQTDGHIQLILSSSKLGDTSDESHLYVPSNPATIDTVSTDVETTPAEPKPELPSIDFKSGLGRRKTKLFIHDVEPPPTVIARFRDLHCHFDQPLVRYLRKKRLCPNSYGIDLLMLAPSQDEPHPWIVVSCEVPVFRAVKKFFSRSSIKEAFQPVFEIAILNSPLVAYGKGQKANYEVKMHDSSDYPYLVYLGQSGIATFGGFLELKSMNGVTAIVGLTAAHPLYEPDFPETEVDDVSESDSDTSPNSDVSDEGSETDLDSYHSRYALNTVPISVLKHPNVTIPIQNFQRQIGQIKETKLIEQAFSSFNNDWALISLKSLDAELLNRYTCRGAVRAAQGEDWVGLGSRVRINAGRSGQCHARLRRTTAFVRLAGGNKLIETYSMIAEDNHAFTKGDSGSWVMDAASGHVYGHLIAGNLFRTAYVLPMAHILNDIISANQLHSVEILTRDKLSSVMDGSHAHLTPLHIPAQRSLEVARKPMTSSPYSGTLTAKPPELGLCKGCERLQGLIRSYRQRLNEDPTFRESSTCYLHENYQSLNGISQSYCLVCRIITKSFARHPATQNGALNLHDTSGPVYATLSPMGDALGFQFNLEILLYQNPIQGHDYRSVQLLLEGSVAIGELGISSHSEKGTVPNLVRHWLEDCHQSHSICGSKLSWTRNPARLVQILHSENVRVINPARNPLMRYSALELPWLSQDQISVDDAGEIGFWNDSLYRKAIIKQARRILPVNDLPRRMRDAIRLSKQLGCEYIWIDEICTPDFQLGRTDIEEGNYHNAHIILSALSNDGSESSVLRGNSPWSRSMGACVIDGLLLVDHDKPVRGEPGLTFVSQRRRIWPRTIYWDSQAVYWTCHHSVRRVHDMDELPEKRAERKSRIPESPPLLTGLLMSAPEKQKLESLHQNWLRSVSTFTWGATTEPANRLTAVSGVAVQYLDAFSDLPYFITRQEYLAGLWRHSFAHDLVWTVKWPKSHPIKRSRVPTWSWASLPSGSHVDTRHGFEVSPLFKLTEPSRVSSTYDVFEIVQLGGEIDAVSVEGRLRPLVPKDGVMGGRLIDVDHSAEAVETHAKRLHRDPANKSIRSGELDLCLADMTRIIALMDYTEGYGDPKNFWCLEVGKSSMLILIKASTKRKTGRPSFVRVGISHDYPEDFFLGIKKAQELDLVAGQSQSGMLRLREQLHGYRETMMLLYHFVAWLIKICFFTILDVFLSPVNVTAVRNDAYYSGR